MTIELKMSNSIIQEKCTLTSVIGTLLSLVHGILNVTLLHQAFVNLNQEGNSNKSVSTISFNSRLDNSPSPLKVLKFILSADKFLVNLKNWVLEYWKENVTGPTLIGALTIGFW